MEIYCDESGFTGNNLHDGDQPFFVYSAVMIKEIDAAQILEELRGKYKLQKGELKGKNLVKTEKGRQALMDLFVRVADRTKTVVHDKKYALACKVFEHFFEPVLSAKCSFFYEYNFHRFIAAIVHDSFLAGEQDVELLFNEFVSIAKGDRSSFSSQAFSETHYPDLLKLVFEFIKLNGDETTADLHNHRKYDQWILDLSVTSLHGLLSEWGRLDVPMQVTCDVSKPLAESPFSDFAVGTVHHLDLLFSGQKVRFSFPLKQPVSFHQSKNSPGLQVADLVSSGLCYAFKVKEKRDPFAKNIAEALFGTIVYERSVFPTYDPLPAQRELHERILLQMVKISRRRGNILEDLFEELGS